MIPTDEMAVRMSKVLGRVVSREEFLAYCGTATEDALILVTVAVAAAVDVQDGGGIAHDSQAILGVAY